MAKTNGTETKVKENSQSSLTDLFSWSSMLFSSEKPADLDAVTVAALPEDDAAVNVVKTSPLKTYSHTSYDADLAKDQSEWAKQGFYTNDPNHKYFKGGVGDGWWGDVSAHAQALSTGDVNVAHTHLADDALKDSVINDADIMRMQASMNLLGQGDGRVNGIFDEGLANNLAQYLSERPELVNSVSPQMMGLIATHVDMDKLGGSLEGAFIKEKLEEAINQQQSSMQNHFGMATSGAMAVGINGLISEIVTIEAAGDYNNAYHSSLKGMEFTSMTIDQVMKEQRISLHKQIEAGIPKDERSTAVGGLQINLETLGEVKTQMGLTGNELFDVEMQNRMIIHLLEQRGGLTAFLAGRMTTEQFMHNTSTIWAAVPDPEKGEQTSYYDGVGSNTAHRTVTSMKATMESVRTEAQSEAEVASAPKFELEDLAPV